MGCDPSSALRRGTEQIDPAIVVLRAVANIKITITSNQNGQKETRFSQEKTSRDEKEDRGSHESQTAPPQADD
jgi:hypothetical protein